MSGGVVLLIGAASYAAIAYVFLYCVARFDPEFDLGEYGHLAAVWPAVLIVAVVYFVFVVPGIYVFNLGVRARERNND